MPPTKPARQLDERTRRALAILGGTLTSTGTTLQFLDFNTTGMDDQIGRFANLTGRGFTRAALAGDNLSAANIIRQACAAGMEIADELDGGNQSET